jgi:signal transduction histidine kinase
MRTAPLGNPVLIRREGLAKVLALSIAREGELMGALHIYSRDPARDFDEIDRDLANILAAQVSVAIINARLVTQLRDVDEAREQFLSIVSHELRTPLTPLKALAQLQLGRLKRSQERGTPMDLEALARNLESIERQVDRMNGLVNDLLSVSRAGRGTLDMDRSPFDLAAELRDVVGRYVAATREEGRHSFTVDSPETLTFDGDQTRIDQLLMNLIGNAVKYSPRGGRVAVRLARQDDTAEIAISDQGIGIPEPDLERLGGAFTRGIGKAATFAGMGIGLHVAKLVAEAHGGSLQLESAGEDKGTTVRVRLPL